MKIPFVDLDRQHQTIKQEIDSALVAVISESAFVGTRANRFVRQFEKDWGQYLGIDNVVACANGTDALEMTLEALGVGPGDEVIVPAMTWISTAGAVARVGAHPVFVDVHPKYYTMDPKKIEEVISERTKGLIPVHLYGLPAEMDEIVAIADRHSLFVVEDAAQAHGALYKGRKAGTIGHAAIFSFFPGKNLGAIGDAGCLVTNDNVLAEKVRQIGNHGQIGKHEHQRLGRNSRMDGIHAAVLSAKLKFLDRWNEERRRIIEEYRERLDSYNYVLPEYPGYSVTSAHLFVVLHDKTFLLTQPVADIVQSHYPTRLWEYEFLSMSRVPSHMPIAMRLADHGMSLPVFPGMSPDEVSYVIDVLNNAAK